MVVFKVVVGPAQTENRAKIVGDVEGVFTEQRHAVVGGGVVGAPVVGDATVDRQALVHLLRGAVHVEGTEHVLVELALGRGQAKLLAVLVVVHRALVVGGGQRQQRTAVAVLVLGIVPAAPGADGGQGEVAQLPVELGRQALVFVFDVGLEIAADVAVVGAGHHAAELVGKGCAGFGYYTARQGVLAFHVVGDQGQA